MIHVVVHSNCYFYLSFELYYYAYKKKNMKCPHYEPQNNFLKAFRNLKGKKKNNNNNATKQKLISAWIKTSL